MCVCVCVCVCCRQFGQRCTADHLESVCLQLASPYLVRSQNHQYFLDECKWLFAMFSWIYIYFFVCFVLFCYDLLNTERDAFQHTQEQQQQRQQQNARQCGKTVNVPQSSAATAAAITTIRSSTSTVSTSTGELPTLLDLQFFSSYSTEYRFSGFG